MPPKSKRKRSVPPRYRDATEESPDTSRQCTVNDPDTSAPAPQASSSTSNVDTLTSQLAALQQQMQAMQDVILGLASSVHSSTPVTQEPVITDVPHVEPVATAAIDQQVFFGASPDSVAAAGTSTQNFSTGINYFMPFHTFEHICSLSLS